VQGLSPVAVALISRQHSLASLLLPQGADGGATARPQGVNEDVEIHHIFIANQW
jgi:hypothetical protein